LNTFIITAGGIGQRMNTEIPKQFLKFRGKPILLHTLERLHNADPSAQLIITLPQEWKRYWNNLLQEQNCSIEHKVVSGGKQRYDSIKNALFYAKGEVVGIHDGVRPFVSETTIFNCLESARKYGSGVPFLPIYDSLRQKKGKYNISIDRNNYVRIQTPQCFLKTMLQLAYERPFHEEITDDASLIEEAGFEIQLVLGNEENIKITTAFDLKLATLFYGD